MLCIAYGTIPIYTLDQIKIPPRLFPKHIDLIPLFDPILHPIPGLFLASVLRSLPLYCRLYCCPSWIPAQTPPQSPFLSHRRRIFFFFFFLSHSISFVLFSLSYINTVQIPCGAPAAPHTIVRLTTTTISPKVSRRLSLSLFFLFSSPHIRPTFATLLYSRLLFFFFSFFVFLACIFFFLLFPVFFSGHVGLPSHHTVNRLPPTVYSQHTYHTRLQNSLFFPSYNPLPIQLSLSLNTVFSRKQCQSWPLPLGT